MKEISNAAIPAEMNYRALLVVFQWLDFFLFCFFFPKLQKLYIEPTLLVKFKLLGLVLLASFLLTGSCKCLFSHLLRRHFLQGKYYNLESSFAML